ncbi:Threonine--tRNA ligase [Adhaeretor mobilis]|uniref:Threonine--tRNA ligase n=2 Tax=Adhaeretor mobilis TaxID=1930276 RepID=A0A517MRY6_9BACT|nr:threonine--tRNA ligase [Adhaeretor mobilis]QDS97645.1 Threonine--tRNA ligase [Adhaeretor mobilis]
MLTVKLPDGTEKQFEPTATAYDVAADIGPGLAKSAVAAVVDGEQQDLKAPLGGIAANCAGEAASDEASVELRLLTKRDPEALAIMRHSCAHVMAQAVMRLFDGVSLAFGPVTGNGFYYDFNLDHALSEEDFAAIEAEMKKIVKADEPFERLSLSRDEAIATCKEMNQGFKVEHIETGLAEEQTLSFYRQGEFLDLCRGKHIPSTGHIGKAFKLLSVAGAYWKGDNSREQLQRVYATAFFDKKELKAHLTQLEEAKKRDHRVLGKQLELFTISQTVGSGLILWLPKGAAIRQTLEDYLKDELRQRDYDAVYTPNIGKVELYQISGHYPYYKESQFAPIEMHQQGEEGDKYLLKPMNCPHHIMIYKSKPRSYRDLPVRLAEFGTVYRYEQSGELSGMTRVRGFTQDDAHIFCTDEQVAEEFRGCLEMTQKVLNSLGMTNYRVRLGFRDPDSKKYVGSEEVWDRAEAALKEVCESMDLPDMAIEPGEAAFYGPKADFVVTDCIGREWQLGTVQLDYNLPSTERFGLEYTGADNQPHQPVMIHRAPLGSMERFIGVLIEHFAGAFPLWLAPEQLRVLTVSEKSEEYGKQVQQQMKEAGFRVTGDYRGQKLGAKIREGQIDLIPYMLVVGEKDAENGTVTVRDRIEGDLGAMPVAEAIAKLQAEVADKTVRQVAEAAPAAPVEQGDGY